MTTSTGAPAATRAKPATGRAARTSLLACAACGSREPARTPARVHGWQRCRHCGSPIVAPWSDWEAFDGPSARTVVLERPGRTHFLVPRRTLLRSIELAAWLFVVNTIAAFGVGAFETEADPASTWRWLGPLLCVLAAFAASALFLRMWGTVQHLEINPHRLRRYRTVGGGRYRERACELPSGIAVAVAEPAETVSENRFHVRVQAQDSGDLLADLTLPTRIEAEWLAALLRHAADPEAGADSLRCSGCGAPVAIGLEARAVGGVDCPYCRAGFVVGTRELRWPALELPRAWVPEAGRGARPARASGRVQRRRGRGGKRTLETWEIRAARRVGHVIGALGLASNVLFFGGFGAAMLWISRHTPPGALGLTFYIVLGSAMMFGIAGFALLVILLLLFGRQEIAIDEATLQTSTRLAGLDLSRVGRIPDYQRGGLVPGQWRAVAAGVPLLRLTRVEIAREEGYTRLRLETPTRCAEAAWELPIEEDRRLRNEIVARLAERVRALGRDVSVRET